MKNNSLNSTSFVDQRATGPCIYGQNYQTMLNFAFFYLKKIIIYNLLNRLFISNTIFSDNHSKFQSNCIYYIGLYLSLNNSIFQDNNPNYDYEDMTSPLLLVAGEPLFGAHTENAGALLCLSQTLIIQDCYFSNNSNFNGGAIFLDKYSTSDSQNLVIERTIFFQNNAGETGAAIYFGTNINLIIGEIKDSSFLEGYSFNGNFIMIKTL